MLTAWEIWQNTTQLRGCGMKGLKSSITQVVQVLLILLVLKMAKFTCLMSR